MILQLFLDLNFNKEYDNVHPCTAELFVSIFHWFKAGISNAISSFKRWKIFIFRKNINFINWARSDNFCDILFRPSTCEEYAQDMYVTLQSQKAI